MKLTQEQKSVLQKDGHQLIIGGPGSGKTTIALLKAQDLASKLEPYQKILFLSFARATVARVQESLDIQMKEDPELKKNIRIDTYHSFFWQVIKSHSYLLGYERKINILTPQEESIALSEIRSQYGRDNKLNDTQKREKRAKEKIERENQAANNRICFDLFPAITKQIVDGSEKIRRLLSQMYPVIVLDEFQDTTDLQWEIVRSLSGYSTLIALADKEQRIFDFLEGSNSNRLELFASEFGIEATNFKSRNHRSHGTDILDFGNHILKGNLEDTYQDVSLKLFESNKNQAYTSLRVSTLEAMKRQRKRKGWSIAVLVPTKRMMKDISMYFRSKNINHRAVIDMHGAILAAEVIALILQISSITNVEPECINLLCAFFQGKGGDNPSKTDLREAESIEKAYRKIIDLRIQGKSVPSNSKLKDTLATIKEAVNLRYTGDPYKDWLIARDHLENSACKRLKLVAEEAKYLLLLERGTFLRETLAENWRQNGQYTKALDIVRQAFIQEHFSITKKADSGVVIMNMHKAKGKEFDEVVIFEGWPIVFKRKIQSNPDRIVRGNIKNQDLTSFQQNFRVSVTRAKKHTTILTPKIDPCVLLL